MYCGTNTGELKEFDMSGKTVDLKSTIKVTDQAINIPFVINANLHESLFCFDFSGRVTNIKFMSHFG